MLEITHNLSTHSPFDPFKERYTLKFISHLYLVHISSSSEFQFSNLHAKGSQGNYNSEPPKPWTLTSDHQSLLGCALVLSLLQEGMFNIFIKRLSKNGFCFYLGT